MPATLAFSVLAFFSMGACFDESELECEHAVAQLADCCDTFDAYSINCDQGEMCSRTEQEIERSSPRRRRAMGSATTGGIRVSPRFGFMQMETPTNADDASTWTLGIAGRVSVDVVRTSGFALAIGRSRSSRVCWAAMGSVVDRLVLENTVSLRERGAVRAGRVGRAPLSEPAF